MELYIVFTLLVLFFQESLGTRHVVYWDTELIPKLSDGGLEITLEIDDYMDVLCPFAAGYEEFYHPKRNKVLLQLYNLTKDEYMDCDTTDGIRLQTCDDPLIEKKLTTKFQQRSPYPFGFTFRPGATYYYLSKPLHDVSKGCTRDTMRMMVHVKRRGTVFDRSEHDRTRTYHHHEETVTEKNGVPHENTLRPGHPKKPHRHHHHERTTFPTTTRPPKVIIQYETPRYLVDHVQAVAFQKNDDGNGAVTYNKSLHFVIICSIVVNLFLTYSGWI